MKLHEKIFEEVAKVISPVFLVGGSTRDVIMGRDPKDYDFCTPMLPDEIEAKIKEAGRKVFGVGKKFGTLGFKVNVDGEWHMVEVTTFRTETYEEGSRKPEVAFVDNLQLDLSRRDFTMNAIAFDGNDLIDPFEGRLDIENNVIASVGKAEDRFREDPLRMLRAARFASQLHFWPTEEVANAMELQALTIYNVSRERWVQELDKLLAEIEFHIGLAVLRDAHLLDLILTGHQEMYSWRIPNSDSVDEKWAFLLGAPEKNPRLLAVNHEMAIGTCHRLKFSAARTKFILDSLKAGVVQ